MRRFDLIPSVLIFSGFYLLYNLTTNQIFSFDAVTNAIACESGEPYRWFHPNHPLYPFLGVIYYKLERSLGYAGFSIYSLARFNSLLVSLGLALLYYRLSHLLEWILSLLTILFLGSCYAVWNYAVDGRAIGASVFFSLLVILKLLTLTLKDEISTWEILSLAVLSTLTTLSHGIAVFHVLPIAWWILNLRVGGIKLGIIYLASIFVLLSVSYSFIFILVVHPFSSEPFFTWVLGYAGHAGAEQALKSRYWTKELSPLIVGLWTGWAHGFVGTSPIESKIRPWLTVIPGVFFAVVIGRCFFLIRKVTPSLQPLIKILFGWGALCTFFLAFWSAGQEGFRVHVIIPWMVACVLVIPPTKAFKWGLGLSSFTLFILNFSGPLSYGATIKHNYGYQMLVELTQHLQPGDLFICGQDSYIPGIEVLRPYFFPQLKGGTIEGRLFAFKEKSMDPLVERISFQQRQGHRVYLGADAWDPAVQKSIENRIGIEPGSIQKFLNLFKFDDAFALADGRKIYGIHHP